MEHMIRQICSGPGLSVLVFMLAHYAYSQGFFPDKSTLVIVSGVPGDLENESLYHEQLRSCLDIAQNNPKIARLIVLCDHPDSLGLQASDRFTAAKADRAHFLGITEALKSATTNPVVFLVWGHGGRQGATNVFHVRGPRITPEDFSEVAAGLRAAASSWVLYFRGSGTFAAKMSGPGRKIISSDADSGFNSDPIGMSLFLRALRDQPDTSFETIAAELGKVTVAWYEERHLARVEEPTLWLGDGKPQLLARSNETSTFSSLQNSPPKPKTREAAASSERPNTDLPVSFKNIRRVSAADFPEDDAVILRHSISHTIAVNPALATEHEDFIQVLTPEGKRHGDFEMSYLPPGEDLSVIDCEVLSPEAKITRVNPDALHESAEQELGDYRSARRKFVSLPGALPGAILHLHYRTSWKEFPQPYVSLKIPLAGELPIVSSTIKATVPRDMAFHWAVDKIEAANPAIERTDYGVAYSWEFSKQPAEAHDVLSSPNLAPRLMLSLFPDWSTFADWYARICRLADNTTPEIERQAIALAHNAKDDRERVLAIYNFVTGLRYVAVPLGVNSFRPHAAANVLNNHYGDCKDKANLFNTLLRSVHISADLVLVPRFSQAYSAVPGFAFNHAISRVSLAGENLWVDTTDDTCRFGMLPPGDYGRNVLVIAPGANQLVQLPMARPKDHRLRIQCQIVFTNDLPSSPSAPQKQQAIIGKLNATATGFPDYALRAAARASKPRHHSLPLLQSEFAMANGAIALENQSHTSIANLDEDFGWSAQGELLGIAWHEPNLLLVRPPLWLPREWQAALHARRDPLFLHEGYPLTLEEECDFAIAATNENLDLPKPRENRQGPLQWRLSWTRSAEGHLRCVFRAELSSGELSMAETQAFQEQARRLFVVLAEPLAVRAD